jgi:hypothetical protein
VLKTVVLAAAVVLKAAVLVVVLKAMVVLLLAVVLAVLVLRVKEEGVQARAAQRGWLLRGSWWSLVRRAANAVRST